MCGMGSKSSPGQYTRLLSIAALIATTLVLCSCSSFYYSKVLAVEEGNGTAVSDRIMDSTNSTMVVTFADSIDMYLPSFLVLHVYESGGFPYWDFENGSLFDITEITSNAIIVDDISINDNDITSSSDLRLSGGEEVNGLVRLDYEFSKRLETSLAGVNVTGTLWTSKNVSPQCVQFHDGTSQCTAATGSAGSGNVTGFGRSNAFTYWKNETNLGYLNCSNNQYARTNGSAVPYCAPVVTDTDTDTKLFTVGFGSSAKLTANRTNLFLNYHGATTSATRGFHVPQLLKSYVCSEASFTFNINTYTTPSNYSFNLMNNGVTIYESSRVYNANGDYMFYTSGTILTLNQLDNITFYVRKENGSSSGQDFMATLFCVK